MIFLHAGRIDGVVCVRVYVGRSYRFGMILGQQPNGKTPTVAAALKEGWQWIVDNFPSFPVIANA